MRSAHLLLALSSVLPYQLASAESCPPIEAYGGAGDASTDNTPKLNLAYSAFGPAGGCISFGAGTYVFNSSSVYTFPTSRRSVKLVGVGPDATVLKFTNTSMNGLAFNYGSGQASVTIRDLTIATAGNSSGSAIWLNQAANSNSQLQSHSLIDNVVIRGDDSGSYYWTYGVRTHVSKVDVTNSSFKGNATNNGIGVLIASTTGLSDPNVYLVHVSGSNFTDLGRGIYAANGTVQADINDNIFLRDFIGIDAGGNPHRAINVVNNIFAGSVTYGVTISNGREFNITGNQFSSSSSGSGTAIQIATETIGMITGNSFIGYAKGIYLNLGTSYVNIQSNAFVSNTANVTNASNSTTNVIGGGSQ